MDYSSKLSKEFKLRQEDARNIINLIDEGNTIPFIARYRKELTGSCDDQVLREFADRLEYIKKLDERKEAVIASITEQGVMTDALAVSIACAETLTEAEDIYRPYKPKRKTRATVAVAKGLEPLAELILAQREDTKDIIGIAAEYVSEEKGVATPEEAIAGAQDIIAERISDDAGIRKRLREQLYEEAQVVTELAKATDKNRDKLATFDMYKEFTEPVRKIAPHRVLAVNRGEKEDCLKVELEIDRELPLAVISGAYVKNAPTSPLVLAAGEDAYKRLIKPSVESEVRGELFEKASEQAIKMFEVNLRPLLLQPPIKNKVTLGLDPAYRTGCKIAVVDGTGNCLDRTVVHFTPPQNKVEESKLVLKGLIKKHGVEIISIGNGTASKESEIFVAELLKEIGDPKLAYMVVNEAGASVYSASKLAAEEFPDYDVAHRSAISIARRLQDPLAELIKIDPKSIGVGQYQHDMPQNRLSTVLNGVVEDCVNSVGVDLNSASYSLLAYVAGLNLAIAKNIVRFRAENGGFRTREQLLKVAKLGPKAYEQCAGFLRIAGSENILDNTAVHPESYAAATKLLQLFKLGYDSVREGKLSDIEGLIRAYGEEKAAAECGVGLPTLKDIAGELKKPGRDIRDALPLPMLRCDIMDMGDLKEGMELTGTVRNVIDFGVFVDIGVHQDGLVHISQIADAYIKHPSDVLSVGDIVKVRVLGVEKSKNRISLTMKGFDSSASARARELNAQNRTARPAPSNNRAASDGRAAPRPQQKETGELSLEDALKALTNKFNRNR
ncbi:MAG: RNA-binding transcriptional accessory protein [Clostridiales bacterium]|jgi:uncharacterized protein|nr:RNA-binding transcriptional accessory protein [Clostridiales bacterium]